MIAFRDRVLIIQRQSSKFETRKPQRSILNFQKRLSSAQLVIIWKPQQILEETCTLSLANKFYCH